MAALKKQPDSMSQFKLIIQTFLFYWKKNLVLALGIAISTAVITGSLVVGDSVRSSLESQVGIRLGKTTHSLTAGDRFFTEDLASRIDSARHIPSAAVLLLRGIAVANGGQQRIPGIQILGVDEKFDHFAGHQDLYAQLGSGEVIISDNLAKKLQVNIGDQLLFRIRKASLIPMNAPFVSGDETSRAVRVKVKGIAGDEALGRFDLKNSQTSPMNAFFSLEFLNEIMDLEGRTNLILLEDQDPADFLDIESFAGNLFSLADYGLNLHYLEHQKSWELSSERVFIEDQILASSQQIQAEQECIFTYFVNALSTIAGEAPYSFVSSLEGKAVSKDEILINSWLSEDLSAGIGDSIDLQYFVVGPLRELEERSSSFVISGVYDMDDPLADSSLMPYLPGLSDAGNCRDWEAGIPIDLEKIRDKDEKYWDSYQGTPKAIVSYSTSKELWSNRFGECTAIRYQGNTGERPLLEQSLLDNISPSELGFQISQSQFKGRKAAQNGTDFGQLFMGLSFFLLLAGIILIIVLFLLGVESRSQQLGIYAILGFSKSRIRKIIFSEGLIATVGGLLFGLALTILYNKLIFSALNNIWSEIVRTDALDLYFNPLTMVTGALISLIIVLASLYITLNSYLKRRLIELHRKSHKKLSPIVRKVKKVIKWASLFLGLGIVLMQFLLNKSEDPGMFFMAGGLLLISFLLFVEGILAMTKPVTKSSFGITQLSISNGIRNRTRSLSVVILFALGVFLVVTTGSNHKDPYANAEEKTSGTGGFQYLIETTVPVLQNLNIEGVRANYGLEGQYRFVHFRNLTGDDASCLNLNKISQPAILGVDPAELKGRFNFISQTEELDKKDPWGSLNQDLEGGLVPAIADQTVIQWGLGLKVGDTLIYQDELGAEMKLLLIGGLGNSIFQGHVIIADEYFLSHFPSSSGSSFFLLDQVKDPEMAEAELGRGFRDFGWDMQTTVQKLAEFNSVENTYLSIFMILGALGLLLGTVGFGVILVRNLQERRQELALFKAMGFSNKLILRIIMNEYLGLLFAGLLAGGVSAIIAVLPGLLNPHSEVSLGFLILLVGIIMTNGICWIFLLAYSSIRKTDLVSALRND